MSREDPSDGQGGAVPNKARQGACNPKGLVENRRLALGQGRMQGGIRGEPVSPLERDSGLILLEVPLSSAWPISRLLSGFS